MGKLLFVKQKDIGETIYYCTFTYALILSFLLGSNFVPLVSEKVIHWLLYFAIGVLLVKIYAIDSYELQEIILKSLIIVLAMISWRLVKNVNVLLYFCFILGAKGVKFRRIVQIFFGTIGILLAGTILMSQANVVNDFIYLRDGHNRHSLGISYPTDAAAYFFYLVLAYYYLIFNKITWRSYVAIAVIDFVIYEVTQARNSFLLILLTIPTIWVAQRASQGHLISRGLASFYWIFPSLVAYCTVLLSYLYRAKSGLFRIVNHALSGRLELSHQAIERHGFSILGQHFRENGWGGSRGFKNFYKPGFSYFYIDSSYIRLAVIYGLIIAIIIVVFMTVIAYHSIASHEFVLAAIIMLISIHCIVEQHLMDFSYNPFLLALFASLPSGSIKNTRISGGKHERN